MLQLRHLNYQLSSLLPATQRRTDSDIIRRANSYATINRVHVGSKDIGDALMPFFFKGIKLYQRYAEISTHEESNEDFEFNGTCKAIVDLMIELAAAAKNQEGSINDVAFFRIYSDDIDRVRLYVEGFHEEELSRVPDAIQNIYDKMSADTKDRSNYDAKTYAYYNLENHLIVLLSNYDDYEQASDTYLTIGLLPVLFPHVKELLDDVEIDYCKAFVRRAQIKRITNTFIRDAFEACTSTDKYKKMLDDLKYNKILEDINYMFTNNLQQQVENQEGRVHQYLQEYQRAYESYLNLQKQIRERVDNKDKLMEEVKLALKTDGVVEFKLTNQRSILELILKVPCLFYAQDEAELVVNRMGNSLAKRIYQSIFVENKYTLWLVNRFQFKLMNENGQPPRLQRPDEVPLNYMMDNDGLFNPHTHFYQCIGDYEPQLVKTQAEGDLLGFVNVALASSKSINFRDGTVINRFTEYLNSMENSQENDWNRYQLSLVKCLEDEDGNFHSIRDIFITPTQEAREVDVTDVLDDEEEEDDL